jgi:hypothetical protein
MVVLRLDFQRSFNELPILVRGLFIALRYKLFMFKAVSLVTYEMFEDYSIPSPYL